MRNRSIKREGVPVTRREWLSQTTMGMGSLGLAALLQSVGELKAAPINPLAAKAPPRPARAKRVIHIFLNGGPSQVDTFDPKPALSKYAGKAIPIHLRTERKTTTAFPSPFRFRHFGQSGMELSEIFSSVGQHADDLCLIRSMHTNVPNHGPSLMMMNCGTTQLARPSFGAWITYGLGSENNNLPGFMVLCPGGYPVWGAKNWRSAFLPGTYQATQLDTLERDPDKLIAHVQSRYSTVTNQRRQLDLLAQLNQRHQEQRGVDPHLESRIQSFELAFRMQQDAADAFNLNQEPMHLQRLYGETVHGRQLLLARRLLERGVRFVQVWHGAGQPWDSHSEIEKNHRKLARECDQPIAALLQDLKQRGMLEDTLVICGGEFGRTPTTEIPSFGSNDGVGGRDHNSYGFSMWIAGAGVRGGYVHGATDEFGFAAVEKRVHVHDLHATLLHLLGFDHEQFTYRHAGRDFRLTDVHGRVVKDLIA